MSRLILEHIVNSKKLNGLAHDKMLDIVYAKSLFFSILLTSGDLSSTNLCKKFGPGSAFIATI